MKHFISRIVDALYLPIFRFIPRQTFRYAVVGGANVAYGIVQYWFIYNFLLNQENVDFGIVVISAPIMSFLINFVITFFTGFWLTRNIAFDKSTVRGRIQLVRYAMVVALNVGINYLGLKLLVETCGFYPSIVNAFMQLLTVSVSYLSGRFYTFR
ncbi:MAG: GtrA family protein [Mucinivorans sp.]